MLLHTYNLFCASVHREYTLHTVQCLHADCTCPRSFSFCTALSECNLGPLSLGLQLWAGLFSKGLDLTRGRRFFTGSCSLHALVLMLAVHIFIFNLRSTLFRLFLFLFTLLLLHYHSLSCQFYAVFWPPGTGSAGCTRWLDGFRTAPLASSEKTLRWRDNGGLPRKSCMITFYEWVCGYVRISLATSAESWSRFFAETTKIHTVP